MKEFTEDGYGAEKEALTSATTNTTKQIINNLSSQKTTENQTQVQDDLKKLFQ